MDQLGLHFRTDRRLRAGGVRIRWRRILCNYVFLFKFSFIYIYMFVFSRISWHQIFSFPWENQRYSAQVKASWGLRALRCLLFGSYWPYECDAGGGGPQRPSDPGWVPPPALSSCSGGRIKRVSLTGLTPSHPLHQSEGSEVRSIGSPWPTVCNRA